LHWTGSNRRIGSEWKMRVKAAVLFEQGLTAPFSESRPYRIEEVDLEGPGEGEVLVKVAAAGLCHSDLTTVMGQRPRTLPIVGGHEGAGVVVDVGRGVRELAPGDHVVMALGVGCGHCSSCLRGRTVLCGQIRRARLEGALANGARRFSISGRPIQHYSGVSSFSDHTITMPENLVKIDKRYPLDVAAMFGCAVVTGAGAVFNAAKLRPGQSTAVVGLGGVGLNTVMAAKIAGASQVIGIDIDPGKLTLASELGCTATLLAEPAEMLRDNVRELTDGGTDFTFEVTGRRSAMTSAIEITRPGGEIVCIGVAEANAIYNYPHTRTVGEELVIRGSHMGSGNAHRDIPVYLNYFGQGRMPVDRLRSHTIGLAGLNVALDRLTSGVAVRQIVVPGID
jgi:Zn-dependent alcohol dehydrogenase